jgi:catechol 2,3-dioxygenase-like lactoylglutathione lyase family enzyme
MQPAFVPQVKKLIHSPAIHHVGIISPTEAYACFVMQLFGFVEDYRGFVSEWSALCIFTKPENGSPIEFVVPSGGPLEKFNKGAGGLHHIALEVPDIVALSNELDSSGMKLLAPTPVKGAGPFLCNFLDPTYTRGVTVEFVQPL